MNVFSYKTSKERKLDCIQLMLFNHVMDLKKRREEVDETYLLHFFSFLKLRNTALSEILNELETHEKVIVLFDCKKSGNKQTTTFKVFHADGHKWDELLCGLEGNQSGLCLSFCFNSDLSNSPWYFASEKDLRGSVLSKVFDIK